MLIISSTSWAPTTLCFAIFFVGKKKKKKKNQPWKLLVCIVKCAFQAKKSHIIKIKKTLVPLYVREL
jgi:hypothetical protein